jgi:hypothetical protein
VPGTEFEPLTSGNFCVANFVLLLVFSQRPNSLLLLFLSPICSVKGANM